MLQRLTVQINYTNIKYNNQYTIRFLKGICLKNCIKKNQYEKFVFIDRKKYKMK